MQVSAEDSAISFQHTSHLFVQMGQGGIESLRENMLSMETSSFPPGGSSGLWLSEKASSRYET
ncbi:MAG: hypothetical protein CO029_02580 [Candidatus Magasanikbacteria bacterium CG_4_9_14_0_2_um_filter_41_10]|nr:MAG: hypothetical protein CO029_02580 [Candidatus Magasanikbacteria bacterium CG_4_9_14_0_2_um_filter_41_10]